jgi:primosomal protein N' (replication factor Y)
MQIAQIVPKIRTRGEGIFDYSIPPQFLPEIKIGLLVLVPFRGRNIEGIIIDIKRSTAIENLKPIVSIIDTTPVVDEIHIKLAHWMADYYLTDFSKCLFENIVPPAKRAIKNSPAYSTSTQEKPASKISETNKKYLIVADFSSRLEFYLKTIKKTLAQNKQVIILVPDLDLVHFFTSQIKEKVFLIHAGLTMTERWGAWNSIRNGEAKIIIGSNSALFSPTKNLGLIIIDREENETYKSDQAPRFNAAKAAGELTKITSANLVTGSSAPSVESYFRARKNRYLYKIKNEKLTNVSIVNMAHERGIFSEPFKNKISLILENNQKAIVVLNRKGEGARLFCTDCHWVYSCPQCKLPLTPNISDAYCPTCEKNFLLPQVCPNCHHSNLKNIGMTTARVEKMIKELWPKTKTIRIEKDHKENINEDWNIAIVTSFALKINFPQITFTAIMDIDQGLNFPGFKTEEKNFQTYYKFLKMAQSGLIQTRFPENTLIKNLAGLNYENFYQDELANRQKFNFPPFVSLIKIIYKNKDENICHKESEIVFNKLKEIINQNNFDIDLLGPSTLNQKHGIHNQQILLKLNKRYALIDHFLKKLPQGWIVDVDPYDIN